MIRPLRGRLIVTREKEQHGALWTPDPARGAFGCDRGRVLAAGEAPDGAEPIDVGAYVLYHGPADKLAIDWDGKRAWAVHWNEVLAVVEGR